ncbi:MAG: molybdopterin-dependent oxidoreductase, partial [Bacteroidetes bacterium]|nr:molybdopterin-dependent oxidoreductase [Bacteroidota bacterium]
MGNNTRTEFRTCPLCEATCGLQIEIEGNAVKRIRGDRDDVFSHGFICPKGSTLKQLHEDPDRLRTPLIKRDGVHEPATWDEAWAAVAAGLGPHLDGDRNAIGVYLGNPNVHNLAAGLFNRVVLKALGTRNIYTASTVDQMPRHTSSGYLYGDPFAMPVPDLDRTDHLLMLGSNPAASNGSLCTAPDFCGRLDAIRERGGSVILVDPRRT